MTPHSLVSEITQETQALLFFSDTPVTAARCKCLFVCLRLCTGVQFGQLLSAIAATAIFHQARAAAQVLHN